MVHNSIDIKSQITNCGLSSCFAVKVVIGNPHSFFSRLFKPPEKQGISTASILSIHIGLFPPTFTAPSHGSNYL